MSKSTSRRRRSIEFFFCHLRFATARHREEDRCQCKWTVEPCGRRWRAIGKLRMRAISKPNMTFTARMRCWITRNRASDPRAAQDPGEPFRQPNEERFAVRRITGSGEIWVTEFVMIYDGVPSYAVSIMEYPDGLVAQETQYFADHFDPAPSRAHLVERGPDDHENAMPGRGRTGRKQHSSSAPAASQARVRDARAVATPGRERRRP